MTDRTPVQQDFVPHNELETVGLRVAQAFNDRDLEAGLALAHPEIIAMPSRVHGGVAGVHGHDGLREWAERMQSQTSGGEVHVTSMRLLQGRPADGEGPLQSRLALFGDMCLDGEPVAPWATVLTIQDGLVIRQHSYLSTSEELEQIGVLRQAAGPGQLAA